MAIWHDVITAREQWLDAPMNDDVLEELLEVSKTAVIAYAPKLPVTDPPTVEVPATYRAAQLMQMRNVWNAGRVDDGGGMGTGEFVYRPHPLDWHIRQLLRPSKGVPSVR